MDTEEDIGELQQETQGFSYPRKAEFSKPVLAMEAVKKCFDARGHEMKPGYFNFKFDNQGNQIKVWVPDARMIFVSNVKALKGLLNPEITKHAEHYKQIQDLEKEEQKIYDKYSYREIKLEAVEQIPNSSATKPIIKETGYTFMPAIGDAVLIRVYNSATRSLQSQAGIHDYKVHRYWNELVLIYDKVFAVLNNLIDKLKYYAPRMSFGEFA